MYVSLLVPSYICFPLSPPPNFCLIESFVFTGLVGRTFKHCAVDTLQVWDSVWSDTDLQGDQLRMLKNWDLQGDHLRILKIWDLQGYQEKKGKGLLNMFHYSYQYFDPSYCIVRVLNFQLKVQGSIPSVGPSCLLLSHIVKLSTVQLWRFVRWWFKMPARITMLLAAAQAQRMEVIALLWKAKSLKGGRVCGLQGLVCHRFSW